MVLRCFGAQRARVVARVQQSNKRAGGGFARTAFGLTLSAMLMSGCMEGPPTAIGPKRLVSSERETASIESLFANMQAVWSKYIESDPDRRTGLRNEIMAARMYAIDVNYTDYEHALNVEGQSAEFWSKFAASTLTTIATVVPVDQTVRGLNAIAHGTELGMSAYNDAFFRKQLIQNIMTSMRAARHERRAVLRNRMTCSATIYPLGLAMSDIESYFRAGTIESGIIRLTRTNTQDESDAKKKDDVAGPTSSKQAKDNQANAQGVVAATDSDAVTASSNTAFCNPNRIASFWDDPTEATAMRSNRNRYVVKKPNPAPVQDNPGSNTVRREPATTPDKKT